MLGMYLVRALGLGLLLGWSFVYRPHWLHLRPRLAPPLRFLVLGPIVLLIASVLEATSSVPSLVHLVSLFILLTVLLLNRHQPFLPLVLAGAASNLAVVLANGGRMPADARTLAALGLSDRLDALHYSTGVATLAPLSDIFGDLWLNTLFSIGDLLLVIGGAAWVISFVQSGRGVAKIPEPRLLNRPR